MLHRDCGRVKISNAALKALAGTEKSKDYEESQEPLFVWVRPPELHYDRLL